VVYILSSVFILLTSFFLFKKVAGSLIPTKPNMISYIFYYNIFLQVFIGSVLSILLLDKHYVISSVGMDVRFYAWLAVMYTMIALPLGMMVSKRVCVGKKRVDSLLDNYVRKDLDVNGLNGKALKYSVWCFTGTSILACMYTFYVIGYFPFYKALTSSSAELTSLRISVSRNFSGNVYVRNFLGLAVMPIMAYAWTFYALASKKFLDTVMAAICFIFSASILYYSFEKSPLLWFLLSFIFVFYYARGKIKFSYIVGMFFVVLLLILLMYGFKGESISDFISYNSGPIGRVILGQAAGLFIIFDLFPSEHDFIGLSSLSRFLADVFNYQYIDRAARIAMEEFNPSGVAEGEAGVMNSLFIAEAWANFGLIGVLAAPFWVGFLIHSLYTFFLRRPKSPLNLAFFVSFSIGGSVTGGVNDYIYNPGVLMMVFLFSIIMGLAIFFNMLAKSAK